MSLQESIHIDGSSGNGGGEILRSSLTLAMLTGRAFRLTNIRANKKNSGLLRHDISAIKAAAEICQARTKGVTLLSKHIDFYPGTVRAGDYHFRLNTARSVTNLAPMLIPPLLTANQASTLAIEGGTHIKHAPPFEFLTQSYLPTLKKIGATVEATLIEYGFHPAGGGKIIMTTHPRKTLRSLNLTRKNTRYNISAGAITAHLPTKIAQRELDTIHKKLDLAEEYLKISVVKRSSSPGNLVIITVRSSTLHECFSSFGEPGLNAQTVANKVCEVTQDYLESNACVSPFLAEHLIIPLTLSANSVFTTLNLNPQTQTTIEIITRFKANKITISAPIKAVSTPKDTNISIITIDTC